MPAPGRHDITRFAALCNTLPAILHSTKRSRDGIGVATAIQEVQPPMERNASLKSLSQQLRKNQTKEENLLWHNFLKKYPMRFRRQYVIGNYIVDFYCHQPKLVVELDGSQHYDPAQQEKDQQRTAYLASQGLTVLRFTNLEVTRQFSVVCQAIDDACTNAFPRGEGGTPQA